MVFGSTGVTKAWLDDDAGVDVDIDVVDVDAAVDADVEVDVVDADEVFDVDMVMC